MMGRWVTPTPSGSDQKPFADLVICESKKERPLRVSELYLIEIVVEPVQFITAGTST